MRTAAVIFNIALLVLEAAGLRKSLPDRKWLAFAFYTQLSNMTAALSSAVLLLFGERTVPVMLRYLGSCMMIMTFMVTVCVLVPMGGDPKMLLFSGSGLFHHLICPLVCVVSYVFFEEHCSWWLVPTIVTFAYGMIMLYLNYKGTVDGPYPFFRVRHQSAGATVLWMAALTCLIAAISLLLRAAAR